MLNRSTDPLMDNQVLNSNLRRPLKVLLADDNKLNKMVISIFLKKNKAEVKEAENGEEAIEKLSRDLSYDLILMDIQMPVMDSIEATRHIRSVMKNEIPIIAITANAAKDELMHFVRIGMNDYLLKPFDEQKLMEKICYYVK